MPQVPSIRLQYRPNFLLSTLTLPSAPALKCNRRRRTGEYAGLLAKLTLAAYAEDTGALIYIAWEPGYSVGSGLEVIIKDFEAAKLATDAWLAGEADISYAWGLCLHQ